MWQQRLSHIDLYLASLSSLVRFHCLTLYLNNQTAHNWLFVAHIKHRGGWRKGGGSFLFTVIRHIPSVLAAREKNEVGSWNPSSFPYYLSTNLSLSHERLCVKMKHRFSILRLWSFIEVIAWFYKVTGRFPFAVKYLGLITNQSLHQWFSVLSPWVPQCCICSISPCSTNTWILAVHANLLNLNYITFNARQWKPLERSWNSKTRLRKMIKHLNNFSKRNRHFW